MLAKLEAASEALRTGVGEVVIAPGAASGVISKLLAGGRMGTRLVAEVGVSKHG
jgi:acetylglutamate kinase